MTQKSQSDVQYLLENQRVYISQTKWIPSLHSDTTRRWINRRQANSGQSTLLEDKYFLW